jgi:four helix bundle protein
MEGEKKFVDVLVAKAEKYVDLVYEVSGVFPNEERYGVTSQLRRSAMSVVLNIIEGYARRRDKVYVHFLEISYGSLKESKFLLNFSKRHNYIKNEKKYLEAISFSDEIGAMLWKTIQIKKSNIK